MAKRVPVDTSEEAKTARIEWETIRSKGSWADREAFIARPEAHLILTAIERKSFSKELKARKRHLREISCTSTAFEQAWFGSPRIDYAPNQRCACANCNKNGKHTLWPNDRIVMNGISRECHYEQQEVDPELAEDIELLNAMPPKIGSVIDARNRRSRANV